MEIRPELIYVDQLVKLNPDTIARVCDADYWLLRQKRYPALRKFVRLARVDDTPEITRA